MFSWIKAKVKSFFSKEEKEVKTRGLWKYKFIWKYTAQLEFHAKPRFSFFTYARYGHDYLGHYAQQRPEQVAYAKKWMEENFFASDAKHKRNAWVILHASGVLSVICGTFLVGLFAVSFPNAFLVLLGISAVVSTFIYTVKNL